MLVLSRRRDQAIMIGDDVEIIVVDIRGDKVRLGVRAPENVAVHRREIYDLIKRENKSAAAIRPEDLSSLPPGKVAMPLPMKIASTTAETTAKDDPFLTAAFDEAKKGLAEGGLPIGSVLVRSGQIIARGHDRRVQEKDPMAHAEINCLTNGGRQATYKDTVLYSTLMPSYLSGGAAAEVGVPRVIVGESVHLHGDSTAFMRSHGIEVVDLHDAQCTAMLSKFIQDHPALWNGDAGKK